MEVEERDGATRSTVLGTRKPSAWLACPVCSSASLLACLPANEPANQPATPSSLLGTCTRALVCEGSATLPSLFHR